MSCCTQTKEDTYNFPETIATGGEVLLRWRGGPAVQGAVRLISAVGNFRLRCVGSSLHWGRIFMQLDLDLPTKSTIYMCWLIKLIHKYGAFSAYLSPMPPSYRAKTEVDMWFGSHLKPLVPCTGRTIPAHVKRSQTCCKSRETSQAVVCTPHPLSVQRTSSIAPSELQ